METKQLKLTLMIRAPGSGKTTFAKEFLKNAVLNPKRNRLHYLSSDDLREKFGKGPDDQSVTSQVFDHIKKKVVEYLEIGDSVLVDATNMNKKDRKFYIDTAISLGATVIGYVFECDKNTLLERNKKSRSKISFNVNQLNFIS